MTRGVALGVAFVCVALAAPSAGAKIVPQRGIGGITLSMTKAEVRAKLGRPRSVTNGRNQFGRFALWRFRHLDVLFQGGNRVTSMQTDSSAERTASGVGVGSTERFLRAHLRGERCRTDARARHCFIGAFRPGRRITDFLIAGGRVTRVIVGFVID